jgi:hypothetical protein
VIDERDTTNDSAMTETAAPSRGRRTLRRVLVGLGWTAVVLVAVATALYAFGGMWVWTPEMRSDFEARVEAGTAEPIESRFVIPIPGCVCHSDDPVTQAQHSVRRINECMRCHGR